MMTYPGNRQHLVADNRVENLEKRGLWRRAVTRWLEVMYEPDQTDKTRSAAAMRRDYCQRIAAGAKPDTRLKDV
ncbi:PerC family transcriptional regulator [Klebsiella aerogenes]|uniref:PerC family transcriptional regulator n=1 Tax=Klebsiella aerogenes TaxID=548 RepID=UPI001F44A046|nr:PerC family transcriptional regulator [Klebsiella aerogenes]